MPRPDDAELASRVRAVVEPELTARDAQPLEVEVTGPPGRRVVRIVVDHCRLDVPGALSVDELAAVSRRLGELLDDADIPPGAYTLEVTSPGTDRPLTGPRDLARNLGREVRLVRRGDDPVAAPLTGSVVAVTDDALTLEVEGAEVVVPFDELDHATVVLPW